MISSNAVTIILMFAIILIIGGAILIAIVMRGGKKIDQDKYRSYWLKIENSLQRDQEASYHLAILNADKLLDSAMKDLGYKGTTAGERLKIASRVFSNLNAVWAAHKLRNRIAHEPDVKIDYVTTRRALASFKKALKDIGAI